MKLKLHYFLIIAIASKTYSQNGKPNLPLYNLYYLSKYSAANENLTPLQAEEVFYALYSNIGEAKMNDAKKEYSQSEDPDKARKKPIGAFLTNRDLVKNQIKTEIYSILKQADFESIKARYQGYDAVQLQDLKTFFDDSISKTDISLLYIEKNILDSLNIGYKLNNDTIISKFSARYKNQINPREDIDKNSISQKADTAEKLIEDHKKYEARYLEKIMAFAAGYVKDKKFVPNYDIKNYTISDPKIAAAEINLNSTIQASEQRAAASTYKLPSESDMINAMAMFLAKRAQQEMAIWFMDKIRENIRNPLVYEAFPETIKLIESLEDFKTPNFSLAWRYAIASDFIKMPKNLAESSWMQNFIFEGDAEKIKLFSASVIFGYELNRLISEKYTYRDIIRYFYTHPHYDAIKMQIASDESKKLDMDVMLKNSITILYILTNELFAIDEAESKANYRLLSYEEIAAMGEIEWYALGQLVQLKYGSHYANFDFFFSDLSQKEKLSKWMGNLLISLSQFDKVNKDLQKASEKKDGEQNFNFYNVWQNTVQIIDNLDYSRYLNNGLQTKKNYIEILKQSTSIYENIQNRNYPKAVQKTFEIVKMTAKENNASDNDSGFDLVLKKKTIKFNADGKTFTCGDENFTLDTDSGGCLKISDSKDLVAKFSQFNKTRYVFPFLSNFKNDNYDLVAAYDSEFRANCDSLSKRLKLKEDDVLIIINYLGFYDKSGWDSQKLFEYIDASGKNIHKNYSITDQKEAIRLKYQDQLLKLTAFFGDVLTAKNAEELSDVIDSHALPPTSYKLKRRVKRSIDLNGYVGLQGSRMWTNGFTSLKTQYTIGITAPIGFAYTWSTLKRRKPNNWGFTVDIVDLGNIVNHYLVNSTEDYTKDVHFSEIFSPAASFMYALRKTPFVVFASFKLLPLKTSSVTDQNGATKLINEKAFDATVLSVGVKIDIPLVNLWSTVK